MSGRMIYRCKSKACGHVWAFDYPETVTQQKRSGPGLMFERTVILNRFRRTESGARISIGADFICPKCGHPHAETNTVVGRVTDHICDTRCTTATGHRCDCSCGGKNHGGYYLIAAKESV